MTVEKLMAAASPDCTVGCDCDRYMEIWNNVFTQFDGDGKGNYVELSHKNIDTGMGLERLAVVVQDVDSIFNVDTIQCAAGLRYAAWQARPTDADHEKDVSLRLITDHIRSVTFMVSDGIMPSQRRPRLCSAPSVAPSSPPWPYARYRGQVPGGSEQEGNRGIQRRLSGAG